MSIYKKSESSIFAITMVTAIITFSILIIADQQEISVAQYVELKNLAEQEHVEISSLHIVQEGHTITKSGYRAIKSGIKHAVERREKDAILALMMKDTKK